MRGPLTPSLVEDLALLGSWLPFGQAAKNVGHFRRIEVSEATARRITEQSGAAYVEFQTEEAGLLEAETREAPAGPGLQQLSVDGAMVPLLGGEWAEVKTLAIGTIDEADRKGEARARDLSYFSRMTDHLRFAHLATGGNPPAGHGKGWDGMCGGGRRGLAAEVHRPASAGRGAHPGLAPRGGASGPGGPSCFRSGDCHP